MGCSQNIGPFLVIDYTTAPNIQGYQNGTLMWGATHVPEVCAAHVSGANCGATRLSCTVEWSNAQQMYLNVFFCFAISCIAMHGYSRAVSSIRTYCSWHAQKTRGERYTVPSAEAFKRHQILSGRAIPDTYPKAHEFQPHLAGGRLLPGHIELLPTQTQAPNY